MMRYLLATTIWIALAAVAAAQTPVGRAVVDGRTVTLFDDNSWAFDAEPAAGAEACKPVDATVLFCEGGGWQPLPRQLEFDVLYSRDNLFYGGLIVERIGRNRGISFELMREAAVTNAANATGTRPELVPILETFEESTDETEFQGIVYTAEISGTTFVFANAIFVAEETSGQALIWRIGTEYEDDHRAALSDFIERVRVGETAQ